MKHIRVEKDFIEDLYRDKEMETIERYTDGSYYHFYSYTDRDEKYEWGGYCKDSFYYPYGGVAFYSNNMFHLVDRKKTVLHQSGQNVYQWCQIDALTRDDVELVFLTGVAGSGKTYLSLAYALEVLDDNENDYRRIILSRPRQELQRSQGFLPGDEMEKIKPYMMPFYDSARSMGYIQQFKKGVKLEEDIGGIVFQSLETIKGRSFEDSIVIVDECEDARFRELQSLLTRVDNSKVILCGDIGQVDDKTFNGENIPLRYASSKFKSEKFSVEICNLISSRRGNITQFVIDNFDEEEYLGGKW